MRIRVSTFISFFAAAVLVSGFSVDRAHAQCAPAGTGGADVINCTGTIIASFNAGGGADTINFLPGTFVLPNDAVRINGQNGADTFNFQVGSTVENAGRIRGQNGADIFNIFGILNNSGRLQGGNGNDTFDISGTVTNSGRLEGGNNNDTFNISGTVTNTATGSIRGGGGADTVTISGTVINDGSILLNGGGDSLVVSGLLDSSNGIVNMGGGGGDSITVQSGGTFRTGATVTLGGVGELLTNSGTLSPGGTGQVLTTALAGRIVQTGGGTLDVDIIGATSDLINVTGTAVVDGLVMPTLASPTQLANAHVILSAAGGVTQNGLSVTDTAVVDYTLSFTGTDVILAYSIDFVASGLNRNQTAIATALNTVVSNGGTPAGMAGLINGLLGLPDTAALTAALDQLSPEIYLSTQISSLFAAQSFTNNLFSCRVPSGSYSFIREGQCVWIRPSASRVERDRTSETIAFDESRGAFSAGAQFALDPNWRVGGSLGYETTSLETDTGAETDGDRLNVGGVIKYQTGPAIIAAAVTGGYGWYDTKRRFAFGGFNAAATSGHEGAFVAGQLRGAWLVEMGAWYAKPLVDLNVTYVDHDGVREQGGGGAALNVGGHSETYFSVTPALEIGGEVPVLVGLALRPYVRAGVTFFDEDSASLTAQFNGAPAGLAPFTIRSQFDDVVANISAGFDLISIPANATLSIAYDGRLAEDTQAHGISLKGAVNF